MTIWYLESRSLELSADSSSDMFEVGSSDSEFSVDEGVQGSDMSRAADDSDADPEHVGSLSRPSSLILDFVLLTLVLLLFTCLDVCFPSSFPVDSLVSDCVCSVSVSVSDS